MAAEKRKRSPLPALRKKLLNGNLTPWQTNPASYNPCLISDEFQLSLLVKDILNAVDPPKKVKRVRPDRPSQKREEYKKIITTLFLNCTQSFVFLRSHGALELQHLKKHCRVNRKSRYPELRPISKKVTKVLDYLDLIGMVNQKTGYATLDRHDQRWTKLESIPTVIHPSKELAQFIELCKSSEERELVRFQQKIDGEKYLVDYEDNAVTKKMREDIEKFNFFRTKHTYSIDGNEFTPKPIYRSYRVFDVEGGYVTPGTKPLLLGGRFQSGITQMRRRERQKIMIDGEETTEVDFSHMHISLAYKTFLNVEIEEPYVCYPNQSKAIRSIIKKVVNIALNVSPDEQYSGREKVAHELKKIVDADNKARQKIFEENGFSQAALNAFVPELEIPSEVYQDIGDEKGTKYLNTGAPEFEDSNECPYSLSGIIQRTLSKHEKVLNEAWKKGNVGLSLQKIESDIMYMLMTNKYAMHNPQSRMWHDDEDFTFEHWHESYADSNCIFEPIHDGLLTKKKWADDMKKLMEMAAKKNGFNLVAEIG
ncbi:MAG: hypothetical protein PHI97_05170 [Desulfobulbus sp.]|nr:hypothetical protein [Desulfobulbus sp.]